MSYNGVAVTNHLLRDVRFSLRTLAKAPGFAVITILCLALGIGSSTAIYSVVYGVILNPFAYHDVDRLVSVQLLNSQGRGNGSYYPTTEFVEIAERNTVFGGAIASTWSDATLTGQGEPQRLRGNHCTMNTFEVMGVPPLLGAGSLFRRMPRRVWRGGAIEDVEQVHLLARLKPGIWMPHATEGLREQ